MDTDLLPSILMALIFSFFFSGIEIAFISANKLQIKLQGEKGVLAGKLMSKFIDKPHLFIGTTLIGNTLALVLFGILLAQLFEPYLIEVLPASLNNNVSLLLIQTVLSTSIILFSAEFLPKSIFLINPNRMLGVLAIPFRIIYILLLPITVIIVSLSRFVIVHVFRLDYSNKQPVFGLIDLSYYLKNTRNVRHEDEDLELDKKIFNNALEFKKVKVRECMIPRPEIVSVNVQDGIETLNQAFVESGHSKILICKNSVDDVIGYCHSSALFQRPGSISEILTPIIIVPETMMANELMIQFIKERKSLAIVVDEFGGTSGIVSMEDIIEEIFGEIEDEHDESDLIDERVDKLTFILSARHEIDYLNERHGWKLPIGDYETLGGLVLSYTADIPQTGESISIPPYTLIIQTTLENRIETIRLEISEQVG